MPLTRNIDVRATEPAELVGLIEEEIGEDAEFLRLLIDVLPGSVRGYARMWQELMQEPPVGALPRRYKALVAVSLAETMRYREAAVRWARIGIRWGLQVRELAESMGFNITGQGMTTFSEIGQHVLRAAIEESKKGGWPTPESLPTFVPPVAWESAALPTDELPLSEQLAPVPDDPEQARMHEYFRRAFRAPMPEFWSRLAAESIGIFDGYILLRQDNMRPQHEGGTSPQKVKELLAVAIDTVMHNPWGGMVHLRAAMLHGATLADVREVQGILIMETGMVNYKMNGFDFVVRAEEIAAALEAASK